jgi:hypothetical protein
MLRQDLQETGDWDCLLNAVEIVWIAFYPQPDVTLPVPLALCETERMGLNFSSINQYWSISTNSARCNANCSMTNRERRGEGGVDLFTSFWRSAGRGSRRENYIIFMLFHPLLLFLEYNYRINQRIHVRVYLCISVHFSATYFSKFLLDDLERLISKQMHFLSQNVLLSKCQLYGSTVYSEFIILSCLHACHSGRAV